MDTGLIKAFIMLAETKSYHEAATQLFITQSALTKKINRLENLLGLTLFNRGRIGAHLTPTGQYLLKSAFSFIKEEQCFFETAKNASSGHVGHLSIGFGLSTIQIAPYLLSSFKKDYPNISINLNDISSIEQQKRLLSGKLSVGFFRLPVNPCLEYRSLLKDRLTLIVNKLLFSNENSDFILKNSPFLLLSDVRGPGLHNHVLQYLHSNNLHINVIQQADDIQTLLALVSAGVGVSILPKSCVFLGVDNITTIPLDGTATGWETGMVWNPSEIDPVRDLFISVCRDKYLPTLEGNNLVCELSTRA